MAGRQKRFGLFQTDSHVHQHFMPRNNPGHHRRNRELLSRTRSDSVQICVTYTHRPSIDKERRLQIIIVKRAEGIFIVDFYPSTGQQDRFHPHRLIDTLHFISVRIPRAVRSYQTIVAKVLVDFAVIIVPIACISIKRLSVTAHQCRLVYKIPDKTTLILRILPNQIPILLEATL